MPSRFDVALDAHVVFLGFEAIVAAAGESEFELVRQFAPAVAFVEFGGEMSGVNQPRRTNRIALARRDRPHARSTHSDFNNAFRKSRLDRVDVINVDERNFNPLSARQVNVAASEFFSDALNRGELRDTNALAAINATALSPKTSCATLSRKVESTPPENATATLPSSRK